MRGQKRVMRGVNDLATTHPSIASEWHPTKNGDITPQMVTKGMGREIWWARALEVSLIKLMRAHGIPTATQRGIKFDGSTEAFLLGDTDELFRLSFEQSIECL